MGKLLEAIQNAAESRIQGQSPVGIYTGDYAGEGRVRITPTLTVPAIIPRDFRDYTVSVSGEVNGTITIHNALKVGEGVVLARIQEKKEYIVIARL